jgi:hypothetical protein
MIVDLHPVDIVFLAIQVVAPTAVYLDATSQFIGKVADEKRGFLKNWKPADWAICCLMLGPFGLVAYIVKRKALIAQSKIYPVYVGRNERLSVALGLALLSLGVGACHISANSDRSGAPGSGHLPPHSRAESLR